jgi:outer membrane murein-binding lipoprotein Lpp
MVEDTHVAVLLEEVRGNFKVVGESLAALKTNVDADCKTLNTKVDGIASDVSHLKADVAVLKTDVAVLKTDMADVKARVTRVEHVVNGGARPSVASVSRVSPCTASTHGWPRSPRRRDRVPP